MDGGCHLPLCGQMRRLAAEGEPLDIGEACGAADVGEDVRRCCQQADVFLACGDAQVELAGKFGPVIAHDAKQIDDFAVGIVEDFRFRSGGPAQEDTAHAGEGVRHNRYGALPRCGR